MDANDLKKPKEIMKLFPDLPWDNWDLGRLLSMGLLKGIKLDRGCLLDINSVKELVKYHKSQNTNE